jgi:uncharacterized repeat protein (TIGR01451 family)
MTTVKLSLPRPAGLRRWTLALGLTAALAAVSPASAQAQTVSAPGWQVSSVQEPTNFAPGGTGKWVILLRNVGGAASSGTATVTDTLPAGFVAATASGTGWTCSGTGTATVSCTISAAVSAAAAANVISVTTSVPGGASGTVDNAVTASGAGASAPASSNDPTTISAQPASFGVQSFTTSVTGAGGSDDTQAGAHPELATTNIFFNTVQSGPEFLPPQDIDDLAVDLPPGFIGDPQATPQCPLSELVENAISTYCPAATKVGTVTVFFRGATGTLDTTGVYSLEPESGYAAEFGFSVANTTVILYASVRTGGDYGLTMTDTGVPENGVTGISMAFYGTPASLNGSTGQSDTAFLTNPVDCAASAPPTTTLDLDSWQNPGVYQSATAVSPSLTGCDALSFAPTFTLAPDSSQAGEPAGYTFNLQVPYSANPLTDATPELQNATISLPAGVVVSPSAAAGLQGCSDAEFAVSSDAAATCPDASQIGTVQVTTPLLSSPLEGQIYLGSPECTGPGGSCTNADAQDGNMLRLFLQAQGSGVLIKLPGTVSANPATGQLTATFDNNPQLPFSDLQLTFNGGPQAPLANPSACGTYTTTSDLSPWSSPLTVDATPSSSFDITGCGSSSTFSPSFTAGTVNAQAGAYSPFTLTFSRTNADQDLSGLTATLPDGLLAKLAGVPLCSDADASAGTCPADSQVGTATVAAGPGSEPLWIPQPGEPQPGVYLTGPYKGAPYGLAVEVPAVAGPFNLGTVVVRQQLQINSDTAQVTDVSDPFPTILAGIPLQIQTVSIDLNRPGFTVNPTSCDPMSVTGTLTSAGGLSAHVSSRFQVGGCQALPFAPKLKLGLSGKGRTRSGDHPTLTATYTQKAGQAYTRQVRVALPLNLALDPNNSQVVCNYQVAKAVTTGPADCPADTKVGTATADTPLLSKRLSGPVYLVQGLKFNKNGTETHTLPTLLVLLRGQIAIDLRAQTSVNGREQLVSTFSAVPDAEISKFVLKIDGGKKGILVITGRGRTICNAPQVASGTFTAQSGKSTSANTTLTTPCKVSKAKKAKRKHQTKKVVRH